MRISQMVSDIDSPAKPRQTLRSFPFNSCFSEVGHGHVLDTCPYPVSSAAYPTSFFRPTVSLTARISRDQPRICQLNAWSSLLRKPRLVIFDRVKTISTQAFKPKDSERWAQSPGARWGCDVTSRCLATQHLSADVKLEASERIDAHINDVPHLIIRCEDLYSHNEPRNFSAGILGFITFKPPASSSLVPPN